MHSNIDTVLDYNELRDILAGEKNLDLIIRYLEAQKKILIDEFSIRGRSLVKFTLNSSRHVASSITDIELSFLKVLYFHKLVYSNELNSYLIVN